MPQSSLSIADSGLSPPTRGIRELVAFIRFYDGSIPVHTRQPQSLIVSPLPKIPYDTLPRPPTRQPNNYSPPFTLAHIQLLKCIEMNRL